MSHRLPSRGLRWEYICLSTTPPSRTHGRFLVVQQLRNPVHSGAVVVLQQEFEDCWGRCVQGLPLHTPYCIFCIESTLLWKRSIAYFRTFFCFSCSESYVLRSYFRNRTRIYISYGSLRTCVGCLYSFLETPSVECYHCYRVVVSLVHSSCTAALNQIETH